MENDYDTIVIGAGHNGLVCASYLAKSGQDVLVIESRDKVGGACVTEELFPDCKASTAAQSYGMLRSEIIEDLNLYEHGLEVYTVDPPLTSVFEDESFLRFYLDIGEIKQEIRRMCPETAEEEIEGWRQFHSDVNRILEILQPFLSQPPVEIDAIKKKFEEEGMAEEFKQVFNWSVHDFLDKYFTDDRIKATLSYESMTISNRGPFDKNTAFYLIYAMSGGVKDQEGVEGMARGGMGNVTQSMKRAAESLGADIETGTDVKRILVEDSSVVGVETAAGETIEAEKVVSNAHIKTTLLELLDSDVLDESKESKVKQLDSFGCDSKFTTGLTVYLK